MTKNRRLFTSYKAYDGGHVVLGSNLKGKVVSGGNITHDSITITKVEHVSGLAFNLVSVGQLCDDDCVVSFTKVDCTISKNGKTLAIGHRRNGLYTCKLGDNSKQQIWHTFMVDNSTLWHRRLGHANMRESRGNFYTLMIVDDHSNYTWVVFVESKDDVLEKFKILCKRLENLHDCSIVSIVTNHSSEFDKLQFGSFCEQHGMSYNLSGPFTSQSSEIVERTHRKLRKMSHAMLDEQSIPQNFWCHALDTATYIFNRVYIRKFINKTPYEILRNRKPSLEYFRVFGCKVFILNTKVHLTKFDPKSYEGVFLGYSQTSKAYIVLNKETMRIKESLNVTFDESLPEPKLSSSVEDDRINGPIVQNLGKSPSLEANVSEPGYLKSQKEARGHLIEQVNGE
ncbi:retrovirus-related pol polyprotein from transposon TNT 1-94 [Tanacetum coccineum]|uniref:Retrovirus-related pol polyprotein from transposon TNT 1-94 n=1 Tax=Tanacetum coccineum TaxID=301880 RepID=A0ABQ4X9S5_9ASTR